MAYEVNLAENADQFEVYNEKTFDQARINPNLVEAYIKNKLRNQLKTILEETAESEADEQIGALRYERGVRGFNLDVVTIDGDKGLESAVYSVYGNVRIQDCIFHKINRLHQNAVTKKRGRRMMQEAANAFKEDGMRKKRKALNEFCINWREKEPKAVERFEHKLYRCFEVNILPGQLRKKVSTTGRCEGLFQQIRAKIKNIGAFENPTSVELYVYAIICQKNWLNIPGRSIGDPLLSESTHFS